MIVIPMAGLSSRFFRAGYTVPKYMLEIEGVSLFDKSVLSFEKYFKSEKFIFIIKDVFNTLQFVEKRARSLGIYDYEIVVLDFDTRGQAETVALGIDKFAHLKVPLTVFNIDTFRPDFEYPELESLGDGYLEVFKGSGENWSYVRPINDKSSEIDLAVEKEQISELCCTGLYHFSLIQDYYSAYNYYSELPKEQWSKNELYIAPLYNYLINSKKSIHYHQIEREEVIFCGTPSEYTELIK